MYEQQRAMYSKSKDSRPQYQGSATRLGHVSVATISVVSPFNANETGLFIKKNKKSALCPATAATVVLTTAPRRVVAVYKAQKKEATSWEVQAALQLVVQHHANLLYRQYEGMYNQRPFKCLAAAVP